MMLQRRVDIGFTRGKESDTFFAGEIEVRVKTVAQSFKLRVEPAHQMKKIDLRFRCRRDERLA